MASPPADGVNGDGAAGAVCCMCGDHGLPHELFRCKLCRVRLQHRYCSDLYPRATAYRRCNWCLREPAEGGGGDHAHAAANKPTEKRKAAAASAVTSNSDEEERQRYEARCSTSRRAAAELGRPVKKQKADERAPAPGVAKGNSSKKELMQAGKMKRPVRVKVRRYKLLTEVISC